MTGAIDHFRTHELALWHMRREQFRAMHILLLTRVRHQLEACRFVADYPEDHLLAQLPPPYDE